MPSPCRLERSPRLQAVVHVLMDGREHSTLDLVQRSGQCAVDTAVRELRNAPNDLQIERRLCMEHGADGRLRPVHYYRLAGASRRALLLAEAERLAEAPA